MKDLEKIKSEDLACQVQDANPGNFAIEQEVAQLVGATVPAPTEPSADDARELGAQLLVFLRRALLPIRSALRTAVAAIYAHLDSRCTDYTPAAYAPYQPLPSYDPMRPFVPRTLPNLLTALTAFSARKISDLGDCPDGISFLHMAHATNSDITKIKDDNRGWVMTKPIDCSIYPNLSELEVGCGEIVGEKNVINGYNGDTLTIHARYLAGRDGNAVSSTFNGTFRVLNMPDLEEIFMHYASMLATYSDTFLANTVEEILLEKLGIIRQDWRNDISPIFYASSAITPNDVKLRRVKLGKLTYIWNNIVLIQSNLTWNLVDLEIGAGTAISLNLSWWLATNALSSSASDLVADPTAHPTWKNLDQFLQNFREHIALRLTANGSGKTLTLSKAVRDAIHAAEATYGIEAIIVTQKGWTLSPAPGASSQ